MTDTVKEKDTTTVEMITLTIDGREITVPRGTSVLLAAKQNGINIPTFCWHPKLKSVGSCRICYVEIEKSPKLQVSCATDVMPGMVISTNSETVMKARQAILEFTLLNHPLDCPTCDKGGECDLQNLTFEHGLDDSRFDFEKMRHIPPDSETTFDDIKIGPEIILNRNRCILCYRCVRANKEAFGEYDLGAYERGDITEISPAPGGEVDNPFSGNLVEICPVGALTNSDWRYRTRVWLTGTVSSICPFSSSGANTLISKDSRRGVIRRVTSRCNDDIDDGWLSDITRYGYQLVNSPERLKKPLIKKEGTQIETTWPIALSLIKKRFTEIREKKGKVCIAGMASPSLDNKTLFSFSKLVRTVLESNNIDYRTDYRMLPKQPLGSYDVLTSQPFKIADIDNSDVILIIGSDLHKEHHNLYLRMRKAVTENQAELYISTPYQVKAADISSQESVYSVGTEEILLNGICLAAIEDGLVDSNKLGNLHSLISPSNSHEAARVCSINREYLGNIAKALVNGNKVTIIGGEIISRSRNRDSIASALCNLNLLFGLSSKGQIAILPRYANSGGAEKFGLLPEPAPAVKAELSGLWGGWPYADPQTTDAMMINMKKEEITGCIIMGANPVMLYPDREFARNSFEGLDFLVVADLFETETTALADVVLPLSSWLEYDGDYVNLEGRCQRANQVRPPLNDSRPGYQIVDMIAKELKDPLFESSEQCDKEIECLLTLNSAIKWPDNYLEVRDSPEENPDQYPIPLFVGDDPHHSGHLTEKSPSLSNFCSEAYIELSPELAKKYGLSNGEPVRVESEVGKIIVSARISSLLKGDAVFIPRNFSQTPVTSLMMRKRRIDWVKISKMVDR